MLDPLKLEGRFNKNYIYKTSFILKQEIFQATDLESAY